MGMDRHFNPSGATVPPLSSSAILVRAARLALNPDYTQNPSQGLARGVNECYRLISTIIGYNLQP